MAIPKTMKAAVIHEPKKFEVETIPVPSIGPQDVLIQVKACGICGSDILGFYGQHPRFTFPRVPGHEFSGVVADIGSEVKNVKVGDRVASEMQISCGKCWACRYGKMNHCTTKKSIGHDIDGAMAQYVSVPYENLHILPPQMSFVHAAVAETLAVGYNAVQLKAKVGPGDIVVIIGAGSVGMDVLLAAKVSGAYVIISDVVPWRLEIAKKVGAQRTVLADKEDLKAVVKEVTKGRGADKVFETVGGNANTTVRLAIEVTRPTGTVVVMGTNAANSVDIPVTTFKESEIILMGSRGIPADCLEKALFILEQGHVNLDLIITHKLPLGDVKRGFEMFETQKDSTLKMVIDQFD